jgi:hypothetical protein
MTDNLFQNILKSSKARIPSLVLKCFSDLFPEAINVEWYNIEKTYEAVFYDNDFEKIIRINEEGNIIDTKVNLPLHIIPDRIARNAISEGEIMNAISITEGDNTYYELIVRDKKLNRYLALYNDKAELLNKILL